MGQRTAFSSGDVAKLNAMYKCNKDKPSTAAAPPSNGTPVASAVASIIASASKPNQNRPNRPFFNLVGSWFGKDEENEIDIDEDKPIAS